MAISCSCDFDGGIWGAGHIKEVICRTPRKCDCGKAINVGNSMYRQSMYDYDEMRPSAPVFICEECGDMAENLISYGYCFMFGESIRQQWLDYLRDTDPDNPVFR